MRIKYAFFCLSLCTNITLGAEEIVYLNASTKGTKIAIEAEYNDSPTTFLEVTTWIVSGQSISNAFKTNTGGYDSFGSELIQTFIKNENISFSDNRTFKSSPDTISFTLSHDLNSDEIVFVEAVLKKEDGAVVDVKHVFNSSTSLKPQI